MTSLRKSQPRPNKRKLVFLCSVSGNNLPIVFSARGFWFFFLLTSEKLLFQLSVSLLFLVNKDCFCNWLLFVFEKTMLNLLLRTRRVVNQVWLKNPTTESNIFKSFLVLCSCFFKKSQRHRTFCFLTRVLKNKTKGLPIGPSQSFPKNVFFSSPFFRTETVQRI